MKRTDGNGRPVKGATAAAIMVMLVAQLFVFAGTSDAQSSMEMTDVELMLDFDGLADPGDDHYEGWLIVDGAPVSTGKFDIDTNGDIVDLDGMAMDSFMVKDIDLAMATMFVLSQEPAGDTDMVPATIKPLAGSINGAKTMATLSHNIGVDLSMASGEYILATPSNNIQPDDYDLDLMFDNLMPLTTEHYEGWLIVDGSPVSTGKFNITGDGTIVDHVDGTPMTDPFVLMDLEIDDVEMFVLSIEDAGDDDAVPGTIKPLAGMYESGTMDGMISHNIGVDLSMVAGEYILATPTDNPDGNENSGIWWLNRSTGTPVAGLDLPDLSSTDWIYEGWVVIDGTPVTTGTFDMPEQADYFDGYSSSNNSGPDFPGEDFIQNAPDGLTFPTDLSGTTAVISIEPRVDNEAAPFQFKPLVGMVPDPATDHMEYPMDDNTMSFATGTFMLTQHPAPPSNEESGIWWLNRSTGSPVAGLDLPDLTGTDWVYEGWVVIDGTPVTTGTFTMAEGADDFDGYSASDAYPPFPGEDFIMDAPSGLTFPTDIRGGIAVISIEPAMDDDPAPYMFKPLIGMIPADAMDHLEYQADNEADMLPTGTVMIEEVMYEVDDSDDDEDMTAMLVMGAVVIVVLVLVAVAVMSKK